MLGIKGCQARLGITAPRDVSVHREEIYQKILQHKKQGVVDIADEISRFLGGFKDQEADPNAPWNK